jgi:uncharacterized delta-60 repeat protein
MLQAFAQSSGIDTTFTPGGGRNSGFDDEVLSIGVQPDGRLLVTGFFLNVGRTSRSGVARLNSDGTLDSGFNVGAGATTTNATAHTVFTHALQRDGRVIVGGRFHKINNAFRNYIARLNSDGSLDNGFTPSPNEWVVTLALQPDGRILIGGSFTLVNGVPRNRLARLNVDGSLDMSFDPGAGPDKSVAVLALQPDGKILLAGAFTTFNWENRSRLARLNPDGSLDSSFDPGAGPEKSVSALALQPDGRMVVGGQFFTFNGLPRNYVARLQTDGSLDMAFNPNLGLITAGGVLAAQTQVDGKVVVAGEFTTAQGINIARLNADGSKDASFNPGTGPSVPKYCCPWVLCMALQPDGKVLAGGDFTKFSGTNLNFIARLLADQGGTVEFSSAAYSVDEHGGTAPIAVRRTGSTNGAVVVNFLTTGGTASAPPDYAAQAGALTFAPGETNKVFTVPIFPDAQVEGNETVTLVLGNPIGGVILGAQSTATLTIIDNTNAVQNRAPVFPAQADRVIDELTTLVVTNTATDADVPANMLTYQLLSPPQGASIDANGVIRWTPGEAQGPATSTITTLVTDDGQPPRSATNSFTVTVNEVNSAPALLPISDQIVYPGTQLTVTNSATDTDLPANLLTFSLDPGAPAGAVLGPTNGVFTWTPPANQAPGTNLVPVRVIDDGVPSLSNTRSFNIVVVVVSRPEIESIVATPGNVMLSWSAVAGRNYQVQFKLDLNETAWTPLPEDVTATGPTASMTDLSAAGNRRFYRVVLVP